MAAVHLVDLVVEPIPDSDTGRCVVAFSTRRQNRRTHSAARRKRFLQRKHFLFKRWRKTAHHASVFEATRRSVEDLEQGAEIRQRSTRSVNEELQ